MAMALNRELLGKVYRATTPVTLDGATLAAYAEATNTNNPAYLDQSPAAGAMAPPIYGVVASFEPLKQVILDSDLGIVLKRMLHSEQAMRFLAPLHPGDVLGSEARVVSFWDRRGGEQVDLEVTIHRGDEVTYQATIGLFVRADPDQPAPKREHRSSPPRQVVPRIPKGATPIIEATVEIAPDQSLRYADASGDHNPLHKDDDFAREAGLPGRILHGICTMAMAQNAVIDGLANADPKRLRSLRGRFTRPVFMGDELTTRVYELEQGVDGAVVVYEVLNQQGRAVIKEGLAVVAP